jgi:hypothetical protein
LVRWSRPGHPRPPAAGRRKLQAANRHWQAVMQAGRGQQVPSEGGCDGRNAAACGPNAAAAQQARRAARSCGLYVREPQGMKHAKRIRELQGEARCRVSCWRAC